MITSYNIYIYIDCAVQVAMKSTVESFEELIGLKAAVRMIIITLYNDVITCYNDV